MINSSADDPIAIRKLREDDLDEWLQLWRGYNEFYGRVGPTALPHTVTSFTWSRFLNEDEPMTGLVADRGGKLVGLAHYLFHASTNAIAPVCYLQDLFTLEAARGQGVATALIQQVYEDAKAYGAGRVYWQTHESNASAQQLYNKLAERSGFIVYRRSL